MTTREDTVVMQRRQPNRHGSCPVHPAGCVSIAVRRRWPRRAVPVIGRFDGRGQAEAAWDHAARIAQAWGRPARRLVVVPDPCPVLVGRRRVFPVMARDPWCASNAVAVTGPVRHWSTPDARAARVLWIDDAAPSGLRRGRVLDATCPCSPLVFRLVRLPVDASCPTGTDHDVAHRGCCVIAVQRCQVDPSSGTVHTRVHWPTDPGFAPAWNVFDALVSGRIQ